MYTGLVGGEWFTSHDLELLVVNDLHVVSREKAVVSIRAQTLPPAWVYLVNVRDDLPGVE